MAKKPKLVIKVVQLEHAEGLPLPAYQSEAAAGLDLVAAVAKTIVLKPGHHALIPTGLRLELPPGSEGQVRPRSGLAAKHGITVLNSPGTIDADYRGEVMVLLINLGRKSVRIGRGERIAQLVVAPVTQATLVASKTLGATVRGMRGFGSTGRSVAAPRRAARLVPSRQRRVRPRR
jgi:dUTP pyrophosphatase